MIAFILEVVVIGYGKLREMLVVRNAKSSLQYTFLCNLPLTIAVYGVEIDMILPLLTDNLWLRFSMLCFYVN